jgi:hypothetical protein
VERPLMARSLSERVEHAGYGVRRLVENRLN